MTSQPTRQIAPRKNAGALELTWVNKGQALIASQDGRYDYEWVEPTDLRVREVRLLEHIDRVCAPAAPDEDLPVVPTEDNLLVTGDAMHVLEALIRTPEYATNYRGKVKLVYIDPPFNTEQAFRDYEDNLEHSVWLTMMRDRLTQLHALLAAGGSVWVHLDDSEAHRMRSVLDEVFGANNFVATVVWQKIHARNNSAKHFSSDQDYVMVYAKNIEQWQVNRLARTEASDAEFWNPDSDPRGPWRRSDLTASKPYEDGHYEVTGPHGDAFTPRPGRPWAVSRETFETLRADDRLWWGKTGRTFPFRKRFQTELAGLVPTTVWAHEEVGNNREAKLELTALFEQDSFATPKPERLLQRIIHIGSDPGDIVLDCFGGSGTTAAVAHKMGRRWVTSELLDATMDRLTRPRLEKVVLGLDPGGISATSQRVAADGTELAAGLSPEQAFTFTSTLTKLTKALGADLDEATLAALRAATKTRTLKTTHWAGGGGFTHVKVGPSMYVREPDGVFLADWVHDGAMQRAVAAQLGYAVRDSYPFCGVKGSRMLAVVDGWVDEDVVEHIQAELADGQTVAIYCTALDPFARDRLRRGCTLDKVPPALLETYAKTTRRARSFNWAADTPSLDTTSDTTPTNDDEPQKATNR